MTDERSAIRKSQETVYTGVAAEDLADNSTTLSVICPELLPQTSFGSVGQGITNTNVSLKDRDNNPILTKTTSANHLVATWERSDFRRVPPMVKKGEPVEVYRRGNTDKFYWRATGRGRDFRTQDRLILEVAAGDPKKGAQEKNDTNSYSAYLDPIAKKAGFKTSKDNGEVCAMVVEADLAKGVIYISDDSEDPGNRIYLDSGKVSGKPVLQFNLTTGLVLKMEGEDLLVKVPGKMLVQADDRIVFDSPLTVLNRSGVGQVILNGANVAINASRDFVVKAGGVIGLDAVSVKLAGIVSAAAAKITNLIKGPSTPAYRPVTINQAESGSPSTASNSPDTDLTGLPYRT